MEPKFSRQFSKKKKRLNIKFDQNPSGRTELFHADGRTDRHDKVFTILRIAPKKYVHWTKQSRCIYINSNITRILLHAGKFKCRHAKLNIVTLSQEHSQNF